LKLVRVFALKKVGRVFTVFLYIVLAFRGAGALKNLKRARVFLIKNGWARVYAIPVYSTGFSRGGNARNFETCKFFFSPKTFGRSSIWSETGRALEHNCFVACAPQKILGKDEEVNAVCRAPSWH